MTGHFLAYHGSPWRFDRFDPTPFLPRRSAGPRTGDKTIDALFGPPSVRFGSREARIAAWPMR
jgi:hypothetical protein